MGSQTQKFGLTKLFSFTLFRVGPYMRWSRGKRTPIYGKKEVFDGTAYVACKRSQGRGQIGPTAGLLNETNAFKAKRNQNHTGN
jgi:hypothetical protein